MKYQLDVMFLGGLFPKEVEQEILRNSKGIVQNAANTLQWAIVNGLDSNLEKSVYIINSLYIGSFPQRFKKCFIHTYNFSHNMHTKDLNVGFCNITGIKYYSRKSNLIEPVKKWALKKSGKEKVAIAYALTSTFVEMFKIIKKIDPQIKTCIIIPDLPAYMNTSVKKPLLYRILKKWDIRKINNRLRFVDSYVLLAETMLDYLPKKEYTVIEGIASDEFGQIKSITKAKTEKTIFYAGGLREEYGIALLLQAFQIIENSEYKLVLCGAGPMETQIKNLALEDNRIIFMGNLPRKDVLKFESEATIVVNPRQPNGGFTRYSFPSKNLEYLSSGTPLVCYKLEGIPDEYDDYCFYVKGKSAKDLADTMKFVCELDELYLFRFGERAREFVLENKTGKTQANKILKLIDRI